VTETRPDVIGVHTCGTTYYSNEAFDSDWRGRWVLAVRFRAYDLVKLRVKISGLQTALPGVAENPSNTQEGVVIL
jgi:hypothetical protein